LIQFSVVFLISKIEENGYQLGMISREVNFAQFLRHSFAPNKIFLLELNQLLSYKKRQEAESREVAICQGSKWAARPGPTRYFSWAGGPVNKNCWAGRINFFVGLARPDVFILFLKLFISFYASNSVDINKKFYVGKFE
jgi:hypothetical protein